MLRSLFTGISGLRANQTMMDTTGNNIANVNTTGYKTSNTVFEDTLSQTLKSATAGTSNLGGTNPAQVGLGVKVAGIFTNFSQGAAQTTGRSMDLMIQGDGFFVQNLGNTASYTRNGSLSMDNLGRLVGVDGGIMQGWMANDRGVYNANGPAGDISIPLAATLPGGESRNVTLGGNLPSDTTSTSPIETSVTVYDSVGVPRTLTMGFSHVGAAGSNQWRVTLSDGDSAPTTTDLDFTDPTAPTPNTATLGNVTVDLSKLTQYAGLSTLTTESQDGAIPGTLTGFAIGSDGVVTGSFSNGQTRTLARLAVASFANPGGLEKAGNSSWRTTVDSGLAQVGVPGSGQRGSLVAGTLEMSNVDLAQEFTNLIIAQRGFQANSRMITASDEILQDLINIKR
jgi:flagellar hook protein FlgE